MSRAIDLTGKEFGKLIVIARCGSNKCGQALWLCKCSCGNETIVPGSYLRSGHTTSCGCIREREDLVGQIFGKLIVVSYNKEVSEQKKRAYWNCRCDCGKEIVACGGHLKRGNIQSCGCYKNKKAREQAIKQWQDEEYRQMRIRQAKERTGENSGNYKGGITPISEYLRHLPIVKQWLDDCKKQANYTCELTGKVGGELNTHHLKAFNIIVLEAHKLNNIEIHEIVGEYTQEELNKLEEYVVRYHQDNSNAVVLCKEMHDLFHSIYGYGNNTKEQYIEFKERKQKEMVNNDL